MVATYEALCAEGYSELTAQAIADRTDRSKSALFYHYDSKEALLADFIEYLLEGFEDRVERIEPASPVDRLRAFVDWSLAPPAGEAVGFHTAMLELRAQAPYKEPYREKLRESDELIREALADILRDGIETGDFREHDPESLAEFLLSTFDGARIRAITLGRETYLDSVETGVVDRIIDDLIAPGVEFPAEPSIEFPRDERLIDVTEDPEELGGDDHSSGKDTDGSGSKVGDADGETGAIAGDVEGESDAEHTPDCDGAVDATDDATDADVRECNGGNAVSNTGGDPSE